MDVTNRTTTRRSVVQSSLLLSLILASPFGAVLVPGANAEKNDQRYSKSDIKKLAKKAAKECKDDFGGTAKTTVRPGGTTVSCTDRTDGGGNYSCTYTSKGSRCFPTALTDVPASPATDSAAPTGDSGADPGNSGGGHQAGGGAGGIDPGGSAEQPGIGSGQ